MAGYNNNNYYGNNNYTSPYTPYTGGLYQQPSYYTPQQQNAFNGSLNALNQGNQQVPPYQNNPQQQIYLPLTFVGDYNEAKMFIVKPNQTVYLRDTNNKDIMYIKSVDSQGTTNLQVKKLVDFDMNSQQQNNNNNNPIMSNEPKIDMSEYVKKDEIKNLESRIEELSNIISNINNNSNNPPKVSYSTTRKGSN